MDIVSANFHLFSHRNTFSCWRSLICFSSFSWKIFNSQISSCSSGVHTSVICKQMAHYINNATINLIISIMMILHDHRFTTQIVDKLQTCGPRLCGDSGRRRSRSPLRCGAVFSRGFEGRSIGTMIFRTRYSDRRPYGGRSRRLTSSLVSTCVSVVTVLDPLGGGLVTRSSHRRQCHKTLNCIATHALLVQRDCVFLHRHNERRTGRGAEP